MVKKRAVYIGETRYKQCPVFELDKIDKKFKMIDDIDFVYDVEAILCDSDWLVFRIEYDEKIFNIEDGYVKLIDKDELKMLINRG